ncbi:hypothetical protein [Dysgonomonas sp. 520]|uniref:hypothetical protein n=1 Tax=Dysgonomonas sp. 520 TaxID=2302931 RepID=UPI0013D6B346|nr:hypothetical protein [Dysgonomonas sp. 520]
MKRFTYFERRMLSLSFLCGSLTIALILNSLLQLPIYVKILLIAIPPILFIIIYTFLRKIWLNDLRSRKQRSLKEELEENLRKTGERK